jgi:Protein of unknown function (DUF3467)
MNRRNVLLALVAGGLGFALAEFRVELSSKSFAQGADRAQVSVDDVNAVAVYANFCRVTGTPEEVILDYGLNSQPFGTPTKPILVSQRIVLNFYTAKRMLHALDTTIQRHEATFGELETDVQKRIKSGPDRTKPTVPKP